MTAIAVGSIPTDHDLVPVVVVGGGPVGLALAVELHHQGIECAVIEPRVTVSPVRPRAKTTSARTMELFRRWGIADRVRARASIPVDWSSDVVFCTTAAGAEITRFTGTLGLDLAGSELAAEPGQQIGQPVVEQVLRESLAAADGVQLLLGHRAVGVEVHEDEVDVHLEDPEAGASTIRARYVVGADGARSIVRAAMGAVYEGGDAGRPNLSIVFRSRRIGALIHDRAVHRWVLNPVAPGVVGPFDLADLWWAIATGRPDDDHDVDPVALVRAMVGAEIDVEVLGTDPWQARSLLASTYRSGRLMLVGDAAHQNPPWGGHGFNTGIGDAMNLGWKLAAVLRGWASSELLDTYESERRPVAADTIRVAGKNAKTLATELASGDLMAGPAEFEVARPVAAETVQRMKHIEFHCLGLVLGYGYGTHAADQTADGADFHPVAAAGNRLPHHWIGPGDSLYDHLGTRMTVLGTSSDVASVMDAAARRGVPLSSVTEDVADTHELFDADVVLVRPDQHIAWLGATPSPTEADSILDTVLTDGLLETAERVLPSETHDPLPAATPESTRSDQEDCVMNETTEFTHPVTSDGPANGMTFTLRRRTDAPTTEGAPLVIALPGGTYSSIYFDIPGQSLLDTAEAVGVPVIAVDRPGYRGSTPVEPGESIILRNAEVLDHLIGDLWDAYGAGLAGVVVIGHSIGGAITTALAARHPSWPLLGIALSGCLVRVPTESGAAWAALPDLEFVELPDQVKDFVMYGPDWSHSAAMPVAGHAADAPVPKAELLDITGGWVERMRAVAAEVRVPVHSRQGEFDHLWVTDDDEVAEFRSAFTSAPWVDARLVPTAGHCIDFHLAGRAFQLEQLAFALECVLQPMRPAAEPSDARDGVA